MVIHPINIEFEPRGNKETKLHNPDSYQDLVNLCFPCGFVFQIEGLLKNAFAIFFKEIMLNGL